MYVQLHNYNISNTIIFKRKIIIKEINNMLKKKVATFSRYGGALYFPLPFDHADAPRITSLSRFMFYILPTTALRCVICVRPYSLRDIWHSFAGSKAVVGPTAARAKRQPCRAWSAISWANEEAATRTAPVFCAASTISGTRS